MSPTKALVDEATNQCVNALTGSAQLQNCSFEDDAGRAEDKRTGLSCPDRQAALAKQCLNRCTNYANHLVCAGSYPNTVWPIYFGDISAAHNFARVELCGPPLRSTLAKKAPPGWVVIASFPGVNLFVGGLSFAATPSPAKSILPPIEKMVRATR
jgi:hypothetical protein